MTGEAGFNEVFFSNVHVPVANVFGEIDEGWPMAIAILMNERANVGTGIYIAIVRARPAFELPGKPGPGGTTKAGTGLCGA